MDRGFDLHYSVFNTIVSALCSVRRSAHNPATHLSCSCCSKMPEEQSGTQRRCVGEECESDVDDVVTTVRAYKPCLWHRFAAVLTSPLCNILTERALGMCISLRIKTGICISYFLDDSLSLYPKSEKTPRKFYTWL